MLSKNFDRAEFACRCGCGFDTVDAELIAVLQHLRDALATPIIVNSGSRCPEYNAAIGGAPRSAHVFAKAADIQIRQMSARALYDYTDRLYPDQYCLRLYKSWVHVDVRPKKARWVVEHINSILIAVRALT